MYTYLSNVEGYCDAVLADNLQWRQRTYSVCTQQMLSYNNKLCLLKPVSNRFGQTTSIMWFTFPKRIRGIYIASVNGAIVSKRSRLCISMSIHTEPTNQAAVHL